MGRAPVPRLTGAALAAFLGAACAEAPPPVQVAPLPAPAPHASPARQPPLPARWLDAIREASLGPAIPEGTLVTLGGTRAILTKDGALRFERARTPEPIRQLITVPTEKGVRFFGLSPRAIYRFDDPLGEATLFARSEEDYEFRSVGPGPGVVAVERRGGVFTFFDVESGKPTSLPGLPPAPLKSIAFRSMREGAAIFAGVGLALTRDGGASFHLPSESLEGDAQRAHFVRWDGDAIRTGQYAHERPPYRLEGLIVAKVDFAGQRLLAFTQPGTLPDEQPLIRWLERDGRNPIEIAAQSGIEAPGGSALVAARSLLARIDLRTGTVITLVDLAAGEHPLYKFASCQAVRGGSGVFLGCNPAETEETNHLERPLEVRRFSMEKPGLALDPPELVGRGLADMSAGPRGGAMVVTRSFAVTKAAYARQPNGRWAPVSSLEAKKGPESFWRDHGAGPLADGRIALVHTRLREGASVTPEGKRRATTPDPAVKAGVEIEVSAIDAAGKEELIASAFLEDAHSEVVLASPIEETRDGVLRFTLVHKRPGQAAERIPYIGTVRPGEAVASLKPVPNADVALLHGDHGLAYDKGRVFITSDGGESFAEIPTPPALARKLATSEGERFERVTVSEVGADVFGSLLVGWGLPEPLPVPRPAAPGVAPIVVDIKRERSQAPPVKFPRALSCSSLGRSPTPPLFDAARARMALEREPAAPGRKRSINDFGNLLYAIEEPENANGPPATLAVQWQDRNDPSSKPRAWTGPAPKEVDIGYPNVRTVTFAGSEALFSVLAGGVGAKTVVVRVKEGGAAEAVEAPGGVGSDIVVGAGEGEPVAWLDERATTLFVWTRGGPARAVARVAPKSDIRLEALVGSTITLRMGAVGWVVPIPPAGGAASRTKPIAPEPGSFQPVQEIELDALPLCAKALPAGRNPRLGSPIPVGVDGVWTGGWSPRYDVRGAGKDACIAGVIAVPGSFSSNSRVNVPPKGPELLTGINVDLVGRRAEGRELEHGSAARESLGVTMRRMRCALLAPRSNSIVVRSLYFY